MEITNFKEEHDKCQNLRDALETGELLGMRITFP